MPCTALDPARYFLSIFRGLRGPLALVPRVVAVCAGSNDVLGQVAAAFTARHQMLGSALQAGVT